MTQVRRGIVSAEDRESIRARVPLEELLPEYGIQLVPSGRRFKALCPFHQEKTPSFSLDPDKQFYYCFGCNAGGDVFRFVQEMDRVEFPEAVEILARRAGVELRYQAGDSARRGRRQALYDALEFAARHYEAVLAAPDEGSVGREYLGRRGLRPETVARFRLGLSSPEWDGLLRRAREAGHSVEALEAAGLAKRAANGRWHDCFRGRVMFPITDVQGRVIGFGARTLGDDQPKYLNTAGTALFDKSQVLYALSLAKAGIHREKSLVIVEGYTDAIMAHQAGLDHVVAGLGTAFTQENAQSLRRLANRVFLVFDGDAAGQSATERSLQLLVGEELDVRVFSVRHGKDPCDAILELGGDAFRAALEADSVSLFEFKWQRTVGACEERDASPQERARALDEFLSLLRGVPNPVTRRYVLRGFVERLERHGVRESDVESRLRAVGARSAGGSRAPLGTGRPRGPRLEGAAPESGVRDERSVGAAADASRPSGEPQSESDAERRGIAEAVLSCLIGLPGRAAEIWQMVPEALFVGTVGTELREAIESELQEAGAFSIARVAHGLSDARATSWLVRLIARCEPEGDETVDAAEVEARWIACQRDLARWTYRRRVRALEAEEKRAIEDGDSERAVALQVERLRLKREFKRQKS